MKKLGSTKPSQPVPFKGGRPAVEQVTMAQRPDSVMGPASRTPSKAPAVLQRGTNRRRVISRGGWATGWNHRGGQKGNMACRAGFGIPILSSASCGGDSAISPGSPTKTLPRRLIPLGRRGQFRGLSTCNGQVVAEWCPTKFRPCLLQGQPGEEPAGTGRCNEYLLLRGAPGNQPADTLRSAVLPIGEEPVLRRLSGPRSAIGSVGVRKAASSRSWKDDGIYL